MSENNESKGENTSAGPLPQVAFDGDAPRLAMFVWLEDGTCHQVSLNMSDRRAVMDTILRKHDFCLKVMSDELPIEWRSKSV